VIQGSAYGGVVAAVDRVRFVVNDAVWERVAPLLPGKASDSGVTAKDNRLFLEAVLWRVRTGLPWRDLPQGLGKWNSVFQRFRRWVRAEVFDRVFRRVSDEPDFEYALVDGTIVTAHHKASGARGDPSPGHRPLPRRPDHQDRRPRRRPRQPRALRAAAGPAP
jgi:transposase